MFVGNTRGLPAERAQAHCGERVRCLPRLADGDAQRVVLDHRVAIAETLRPPSTSTGTRAHRSSAYLPHQPGGDVGSYRRRRL